MYNIDYSQYTSYKRRPFPKSALSNFVCKKNTNNSVYETSNYYTVIIKVLYCTSSQETSKAMQWFHEHHQVARVFIITNHCV